MTYREHWERKKLLLRLYERPGAEKLENSVFLFHILFFHLYKLSITLGHHNPPLICTAPMMLGFFIHSGAPCGRGLGQGAVEVPVNCSQSLATCFCCGKHPLGSTLLESPSSSTETACVVLGKASMSHWIKLGAWCLLQKGSVLSFLLILFGIRITLQHWE